MISDFDIVLRLIFASILGGIIGYERQARHKFAGLRTNILVSLGSCLIMILSYNIFRSVQGLTNADPARLAAQVVSSIGFLGAGSIIIRKNIITGLTTAATLWVVAGVGLAVGLGSFVSATTTTFIAFIILELLYRIESSVKDDVELVIVSINKPGQVGKIASYLGQAGINIHNAETRSEDNEQNELAIKLSVELPPQLHIGEVISNLLSIEGIKSVHNH